MAKSRAAKGGFSLVEILVAVSVVAVLALLMVPVSRKTVLSAQSVRCAQNLRSLGQAFQTYVAENNGQLPPMNTAYWFNQAGWCEPLAPWLGPIWQGNFSNGVYYCPFRRQAKQSAFNPSYEVNTRLSSMRLAMVPKPSEAVLLLCGVHRVLPELDGSIPMLFVDGHVASEPWPSGNSTAAWTSLRNRGFQP